MPDATFGAEWLALREPADHRSRAEDLLAPLGRWWDERGEARVVDLGSGTGSNVRYLASRLGRARHWTLVDHDAALLGRASASAAATLEGATLDCVVGDLAREGLGAVARADLVTASALLDLVSDAWLTRLVESCRASGCAALLALSWDGSIEWRTPGRGIDPDDELVLHAVRAHQRRDKGLGPALGPVAGATAEATFRASGFRTWLSPSPWRLDADDRELARALIDGWREAAAEQRPELDERFRGWVDRRRRETAGAFALAVGHWDLLALPPQK